VRCLFSTLKPQLTSSPIRPPVSETRRPYLAEFLGPFLFFLIPHFWPIQLDTVVKSPVCPLSGHLDKGQRFFYPSWAEGPVRRSWSYPSSLNGYRRGGSPGQVPVPPSSPSQPGLSAYGTRVSAGRRSHSVASPIRNNSLRSPRL